MPPSKRRRTIEDEGDTSDHDEEVIDVQSARSELRRTTKTKRSRLTKAKENGGSVVSDEDPSSDEAIPEAPPHDQGDRSDSEDVSDLEQEIRKDYERLNRENKDNQPAEHGVIEEVYCQNFMCHSKLRIKLGPLINFVIGHNGSGKSAVLTALTICLGVKATATNRGASLKKFIKEGQESAMLSVTIKNKGSQAYQPELYGDSIVVERHFNKQGASQFKLKSAEGRIISTKRAELEDMLDCLSLQLDNPLNVLTQDLARQFLSSSTPAEKYKFFMKGTQLEQLDRDYRMMHEYIDQTEAKCFSRKEDISHLKRRVEQAEEVRTRMESIGKLREKITMLTYQHAWAQVAAVENEVDKAQRAFDQSEERIKENQEKAKDKADAYDSRNANVEAARRVKDDLEQDLQPLKDQHDSIKEQFDKGKAQVSSNQATMRHIKVDMKEAEKEVNKFKAELQEEERKIEAASGPAQAAKLAELRVAEETLREKRQARSEQGSRQDLDQAKQTAQGERESREEARRVARTNLKEAEDRLHGLRNKGDDHMKAFHHKMPQVLRAIANETRFRSRPVGPLGMHVRLKKPEWSSIVESMFGRSLEAFAVTSPHDQSLLRGILQKMGLNAEIYIANARPLDITETRAMTDEDTLLTLLDIDNDLVRNLFIINQSAEQTLMIRERSRASDLIDSPERHRNVKAIVSMHDSIRGEGHRFSTSQSGKRIDRVAAWSGSIRMKTDIEGQIRNQQDLVNDAKRSENAAQQEVRAVDIKIKEADQAINRWQSRERELKLEFQRAEDALERIRNELQEFDIAAGTLDAIKAQLAEAEETVQQHAASYTDALVEKGNINDAQTAIKKDLDKATALVTEMEAKIKKVEASTVKHDEARLTALREKNMAFKLLEDAEQAKGQLEHEKEQTEARLVEFTSMASQISPRVPVDAGMTVEKIDNKLERMRKEQDAAENEIGMSQQEVQERYYKAKEEYRAAGTGLRNLHDTLKMLKKAYGLRQKTWMEFRKHITARAAIMFAVLLNERGFKGRLMCSHRTRQMDIAVEPDTTVNSDKGRQAKTLSGGEKSFSTICVLLAIWEAMGSPIRCLDEFDVFMDNVNRDISMRMMIQAARRAVGKQYILITPQSMGSIPIKEDMRIHKMSDPERGQTTITFQ